MQISNKTSFNKNYFRIGIIFLLFLLALIISLPLTFAAIDCTNCEHACVAGYPGPEYWDCDDSCGSSCYNCLDCWTFGSCLQQGCYYPTSGCGATCDRDADCSSPTPTCSMSTCQCVPEFSTYLGIVALIGAIIIPTFIYRLKKKRA